MSLPRPFSPQFGSTQAGSIAALGNIARNISADTTVLRVINLGAGDLYVRGYSSRSAVPIASAIDMRILPNIPELVYVGDEIDRVSLFSVAGTSYEIMTGDGGV